MKTQGVIYILSVLLLVSLFFGCADTSFSDPRQVVISMFGAMEKNDKAALAHILDLPELMKTLNDDYALQTNKPRTFVNPQDVLEDLTETGLTKTRWFSYQRIVNKAEVYGENATVEVTFVDKEKSKGYKTKFGVHLVNDKWKIYSFKTEDAPKEKNESY